MSTFSAADLTIKTVTYTGKILPILVKFGIIIKKEQIFTISPNNLTINSSPEYSLNISNKKLSTDKDTIMDQKF